MSLFWLNANRIQGLVADININFESPAGGTTSAAVLSEISKATENRANQEVMPRSIPHPFAKSIMLQKYLFMNTDGRNDFYTHLVETKIAEWRGFIAMLALQEVYDLDIRKKMISHADMNATSLGKSLRISREKQPASDNMIVPVADNPTNFFYLVYIVDGDNQRALGMTDDVTLFLPGYTKDIFPSDKYPWSDGKIFKDPLQLGRDENSKVLTRGEKIILYAWLKKAIDMLSEQNPDISIIQKLRDYRNDIGISDADARLAETLYCSAPPLNGAEPYVFDAINIGIDLKSIQSKSEIRDLAHDRVIWVNINTENQLITTMNTQRLVVGPMDAAMYIRSQNKEQFARKFHDDTITVYPINYSNEHDLNKLLDDTCYYIEYNAEQLQMSGITMETASNNFFQREGSNTKRMYVFPIRESVKETTKKILLDILTVREISSSSVEISCQFGNKTEDVSRKTIDKIVKINDNFSVPNTFIWPNISGLSEYMYNTVLTDDSLGYAFLPINKDVDASLFEYQTFVLKEYPGMLKCVQCRDGIAKTVGYIRTLPLPQSSKSGISDRNSVVYSLDFGTSSSVIAKKTNAGTEILDFSNQTAMIVCDPRNAHSYVNDVFFAYGKVPTPVPTIYRENTNEVYHPTGIFENGHAYLLRKENYLKEQGENLVSDIKFGTHNNLAVEYIKSILNMILADAKKSGYKQIGLKFSYPISIADVKDYRKRIEEAVSKMENEKKFNLKINDPILMTESEAALRYTYHNAKDNNRKNMIVIDIGGGSVDMAVHVIAGGEPICSIASVAQGSRKFLLDTFKQNPDVLVELVTKVSRNNGLGTLHERYATVESFKDFIDKEGQNYYSQIELLLAHEFQYGNSSRVLGEEMAHEFKEATQQKYRKLKTALLFQVSAFVFYTSLMLGKVCKGKVIDKVSKLTMSFTGKGSAVSNWLPSDITENLVTNIIQKTSNVGLMNKDISAELVPQRAKCESALGMLAEPVIRGREEYDETNFSFDFVIGEKLKNTEDKNSHLSLLPHPLKSSIKADDNTAAAQLLKDNNSEVKIDYRMPTLREFIKVFNENNGILYDIEIKSEHSKINNDAIVIDEAELENVLGGYMTDYISSGIAIEPVFFSLVRKIREEIIKQK